GRSREEVLENLQRLIDSQHLGHIDHCVLFSTRRFKQRGAHYGNDRQPQARRCAPVPQVHLLG
ncbi:MAG: hypothetical protein HQL47_08920, partial [Gammaproteobacteria bacterium]|nr:hypothetical protein [Gammaproteobacteria bacterium]